jgi:hypothetical protein
MVANATFYLADPQESARLHLGLPDPSRATWRNGRTAPRRRLHPDFLGSFSLKEVLPALVPELTYDDLVIVDGLVASVEIARLLFVAGKIPKEEHDRVRQDLLNYCERDT